jgi:SPP1 family predicted phage head-tail adaptor
LFMPREDAGQFQEMVALDERQPMDDGYGNVVAGDWAEQFTCHAGFTWLRAGEAVMAHRLESKNPAVIRIRVSSATDRITNDWRVRDTRRGTVFNIRGITLDNSRAFVDLLVEAGVAV